MTYILGVGGLAREVFDVYRELGIHSRIAGFVEEPRRSSAASLYDRPVLDDAALARAGTGEPLIGAMGSPQRKAWIDVLEGRGHRFESVCHPTAILGPTTHLGRGTVVLGSAHFTTDVRVADHTVIYPGTVFTHDVEIGRFATVCPGVVLGGRVTVGDQVWLGIGATIRDGVTVGSGAFVGAGTVVVNDVPAETLCYGIRGRIIRKIGKDDWPKLVAGPETSRRSARAGLAYGPRSTDAGRGGPS